MLLLRDLIFCLSLSYSYSFFDFGLLDTAKNPFTYLEENNYPYENHTIVTEDGYELLTVRIPHGKEGPSSKKRPPVLFVHAIFSNFYDYLVAGPERAIGFLILNQGYDIWLMNTRGSTHGRKHRFLDPDSSAFWNFSWHEVAIYDVPANIDYITNVTGFSNMSMVGHSQGGTIFLAFAAFKPEYGKRINFSLQLAPVVYLRHTRQIFMKMCGTQIGYSIFEKFVNIFDLHVLFPHKAIFKILGTYFCFPSSPIIGACNAFIEHLVGPSEQTNNSITSALTVNDPAGGPAKQILHFLQIGVSDNFQLYDYGKEGNQVAYNQTTPPLYNLTAVTTPVAIYYGKSDILIAGGDGERLISELPNALPFILGKDVNHIDVQWGTKSLDQVHKPAIKLLNKYNNLPHV